MIFVIISADVCWHFQIQLYRCFIITTISEYLPADGIRFILIARNVELSFQEFFLYTTWLGHHHSRYKNIWLAAGMTLLVRKQYWRRCVIPWSWPPELWIDNRVENWSGIRPQGLTRTPFWVPCAKSKDPARFTGGEQSFNCSMEENCTNLYNNYWHRTHS